jgi:hypothetical protein
VATAHREAAGRTRRLGDGRRRGDGDGLQEEDATARMIPSRTWRPLVREVDQDEDGGAAVRFPRSGEVAGVHGDSGGRRSSG